MEPYQFAAWPADRHAPSRGLVLDADQSVLVTSMGPEGDGAAGEQDLQDLLERGLTFGGSCPRCHHWMSWAIPFGVMVDPKGLRRMVARNGLASADGLFSDLWSVAPRPG